MTSIVLLCNNSPSVIDQLNLSPSRGAKINRIPPLDIHNLHVKFESDWLFQNCSQHAHPPLTLSITISPPTLLQGDKNN